MSFLVTLHRHGLESCLFNGHGTLDLLDDGLALALEVIAKLLFPLASHFQRHGTLVHKIDKPFPRHHELRVQGLHFPRLGQVVLYRSELLLEA